MCLAACRALTLSKHLINPSPGAPASSRTVLTSAAAASTASVASTSAMEVVRVPALSDNYVWILHEPKSNLTAVVDPSEVDPVNRALKEK